ncbi:Gfo/Idh/MocA family protein [Kushneria indalinina]|uniref:Putative dehydrogenase n=1 Tax=Kushneria indalinina DSM 14324 TaxID=1122140 RepID=A0A3D9E071_9GAMM|nr:Gfo/Idh/MocA family oxidoreductase [Kushneria indalinina]REC95874.1 putative dehydrogenase [Kushneria indalinina DSM 14324]
MVPLKLGMVGGGQGAFIGGVHRIAARIDGHWHLVAGALSSDPERATESAGELGLARSYTDYSEMARAEARHPDGIDAVAIVTPNHMHAGPVVAFLRAGIHVICDKPLAATPEQAHEIAAAAGDSTAMFFQTYNYTAYPLIRSARAMVADGQLGRIRVAQVEYAQDWLASEVSNKQADWRTDPAKSGAAGCVGDIGTHAFNLLCHVSGLKCTELAADLSTFVPERRLDDNGHVMLRFDGGAKGMLWSSQVAVGRENALSLRLYGDKGSLEWNQENPNLLRFTPFGAAPRLLTRGGPDQPEEGSHHLRTPPGHPEGYLEGFATLYTQAATRIRDARRGVTSSRNHIPNLQDGLAGMDFITACLDSNARNAAWVKLVPSDGSSMSDP